MKPRLFSKAAKATKLLMLVIAVSLAILPVLASHTMTQTDHVLVDGNSKSNQHHAKMGHSSVSDCEKHSSSSQTMNDSANDNCCAAYCVTYTMSELEVFGSAPAHRSVYTPLRSSTIYPGEIITPHRPPNA